MDRDQKVRGAFHVPAACLPTDPDPAPSIHALLAMQGNVINILGDNHVSDEPGTDAGLRDHLRRQRRHDRGMRALPAGVDRPHDLSAIKLARGVLDLLRDLLADLHEACLLLLRQIDHFPMHRQVLRWRTPSAAALASAATGAGRRSRRHRQHRRLLHQSEQQPLRRVEPLALRSVHSPQQILELVLQLRTARLGVLQERFQPSHCLTKNVTGWARCLT